MARASRNPQLNLPKDKCKDIKSRSLKGGLFEFESQCWVNGIIRLQQPRLGKQILRSKDPGSWNSQPCSWGGQRNNSNNSTNSNQRNNSNNSTNSNARNNSNRSNNDNIIH